MQKVALLAERLTARGHHVSVLTADYGPQGTRVPAATIEDDGYFTHYLKTAFRYRWTPIVSRGQFWIASRGSSTSSTCVDCETVSDSGAGIKRALTRKHSLRHGTDGNGDGVAAKCCSRSTAYDAAI